MDKHQQTKLSNKVLEILAYQRPSYRKLSIKQAEELYHKEISKRSKILLEFLPRARGEKLNFLDIGCGVGFGLLFLKSIYGIDHNFFGLDHSHIDDDIFYGFEDEASAYNKLELTEEVLILNGINKSNINLTDIDKCEFPIRKFDIVSSHIAWGFHFPIATYLNKVDWVTHSNSIIIVDIRNGTDGVEAMAKRFQLIAAIPSSKSILSVWKKVGY